MSLRQLLVMMSGIQNNPDPDIIHNGAPIIHALLNEWNLNLKKTQSTMFHGRNILKDY
jgi:hypothetical protein